MAGAYGSKSTRGSGKSLIGSARRGVGALTEEELQQLADGEEYFTSAELEAGDVLMEVLAEDHRFARRVEHTALKAGETGSEEEEQQEAAAAAEAAARLSPVKGPGLTSRHYLTHPGIGEGTIFERSRAAQKQRLADAEEHVFAYQMPEEMKKQREHERRSKARKRDHDVIENRIQEAMAGGAFDELPGAGKPLPSEINVFEAIAGEQLANKVLKNAGCAPPWVEQGKQIRTRLASLRLDLAFDWIECGRPQEGDAAAAGPVGAEWSAALGDFEAALRLLNKDVNR